MIISVFDIFKIGIGPSSSHTVGSMRAALTFANHLQQQNVAQAVNSISIELYGSLGATGKGHGTNKAVMLGLLGESPDLIDPDCIDNLLNTIQQSGIIKLLDQYPVVFDEKKHIIFYRKALPFHANGMRFKALDNQQNILQENDFYSVGGGFVVSETNNDADAVNNDSCLPYPFKTADDLLKLCCAK